MNDDETARKRIDEWDGIRNYYDQGGVAIDELKAIIDHHEAMGQMGEASHTQAMELLKQLDELLQQVVREKEVNAKVPV